MLHAISESLSPALFSLDWRDSLRGLNRRFLEISVSGYAPSALGPCRGAIAPLSTVQRDSIADCPYVLFNVGFDDARCWRRPPQQRPWRVADSSRQGMELLEFANTALFFAWHLALREPLETNLVLGMSAEAAHAFRSLSIDQLSLLAVTRSGALTARFAHCEQYWRTLACAAQRGDRAAVRRTQLFGLQLTVNQGLPSS